MFRTLRPVTRVLATAAIATTAALTLAGPAQAHPRLLLLCDPVSNSRHSCHVFISDADEPVRIRWYIDGTRIRDLDNLRHFIRGCDRGKIVTAKAVVTDAHDDTSEASDSVRCGDVTP